MYQHVPPEASSPALPLAKDTQQSYLLVSGPGEKGDRVSEIKGKLFSFEMSKYPKMGTTTGQDIVPSSLS